jgi:hypothetical protein
MRDPLIGHSHKVPLHCETKSLAVLTGLDDRGLSLAGEHADTLAHALHLLDDVVLAHVVDDAHHDLVTVLIEAHQDGIIHHVHDRQEKGVIEHRLVEEELLGCTNQASKYQITMYLIG